MLQLTEHRTSGEVNTLPQRLCWTLWASFRALLGSAVCAGLVGCGASASPELADESASNEIETETQGEALQSSNWKNWSPTLKAPTALDTEPTLCGNFFGAYTMVVRNSSRNFQAANQVGRAGFSAWSPSIGSMKFWSSPSCAALAPTWKKPAAQGQFLIAGKGDDNYLYVQLITPDSIALPPDDMPQPPTLQGGWTKVGTHTYANGTNGFPTLASSGSTMMMVVRQDNTLYVYRRPIPFVTGNPWVARSAAPALPSAAQGANLGIPTIIYAGGLTNAFVIMVKGHDGGLYWIRHNGSSYVESAWVKAFVPYTLTSDPYMEWTEFDPDAEGPAPVSKRLTLYFRDSNTQIVQTSVARPGDFGATGFWAIDPLNAVTTIGSPRALFGGAVESGIRTALVRGYTSVVPVADRSKSMIWVEDYFWLTAE